MVAQVIFGMAVGAEPGTAGLGSGAQVQMIAVFIEWLWQAVAQVWETWCESVPTWLMWPWAQHH